MTASKKELALTREEVLEILELRIPEYVFYWLMSRGNSVKAGSKAGCLRPNGYTQIKINGDYFYTHRLIWFITYGKFPDNHIDHIDGDKSNNKIENLRDVSHKVNQQNRTKYHRRDTDLPTGVAVGGRNKIGEPLGYHAHWNDMNSEKCKVYFGIRKWLTLEAALAAAVVRRNLEVEKLNLLGAAYTDRHGV